MTANLLCIALLLAGNFLALRAIEGGTGSTKNLKEIIIGRCSDYKLLEPHRELVSEEPMDCNDVWETFKKAFAHKDPCKPGSYQDFVRMTMTEKPLPANKALFWSGTMDVSRELTDHGRRKVVLANTLTGYLVKDNLQWCGKHSTFSFEGEGINYEECPPYSPDCDSQGEFWALASQTMAERATGDVYVMLNGTRGQPAYSRSSFFARYELPNLRRGTVGKVTALLAHDIDREPEEVCGKGSLRLLEEDVKNRGLEFDCVNDPLDVRHLLCVNAPESKQCKFSENRFGIWSKIKGKFGGFGK